MQVLRITRFCSGSSDTVDTSSREGRYTTGAEMFNFILFKNPLCHNFCEISLTRKVKLVLLWR